MISAILVANLFFSSALPPWDRWFAEDKFRHFVASFVVTSLSASGARVAGFDRPTSVRIGAGAGATAGILKETFDARAGRGFSYRDLVWDFTGVAAAVVVADAAR